MDRSIFAFARVRPAALTLGNKLLFPFRILGTSPSNLLLVLSFAAFGCWIPLRVGWRNLRLHPAGGALLALLPFAFLGAVIPTAPYRQYFYAVVPFLVLGAILGIARLWHRAGDARKIFGLLSLLIGISSSELVLKLRDPAMLVHPDQWPVWSLHQKGLEIHRLAGAGPILTLAPVSPLEGGSRIYQEFCTGVFAWRTAAFVDDRDRKRYAMIGAQDLEAFLREKPPAILTGFEGRLLEAPLVEYARQNAYTQIHLADRGVLWLRSP